MSTAVLIVNLDPPYLGIARSDEGQTGKIESWHSCSLEDIRNLLLDLNAISLETHWPLNELILRIPIELNESTIRTLQKIKIDKRVLSKSLSH
ncbi:MAG: hypothetical protein K2X27_13330 [Candidatus Obscuribacterales bacterium]|nr:hypothetical protein [Candidatus Obscuribacterales bacterium]